jgi:hypothetical protein
MKSYKNRIFLDDVIRFSPMSYGVDFTDESETNFHIPMKALIKLYEGAQFQIEKNGQNWEEFCDMQFKGETI